MRQRVYAIKASKMEDGAEVEVQPTDAPLFRFHDPARAFHDSTLWAWGRTGRPIALVALERYETKWSYELVSLSTARIAAELSDKRRWSPRKPGVEWKPFAQAPIPAETAARRLSQMKTLARRFSVSERTSDGNHYELRLMPQPIHQYFDPDVGLIHGALFSFAFGTNPEAVLAIECRRQGSRPGTWHFGFVPLTTAAASASFDGARVWAVPIHAPRFPLQDTYSNFTFPISRK